MEVEVYPGKLDLTAQFYTIYIRLVDYFLILSQSVRTGNFGMYIFILPKIKDFFFAINYPNYARWTALYPDNLINVDKTVPYLRKNHLGKESFCVRRTHKDFSGQSTHFSDFKLEDTQNADANLLEADNASAWPIVIGRH